MRNGAILVRVSTKEQATQDRHSLPVQRALLQQYADAHDIAISTVFEIPGESAAKEYLAERPQFAAALARANEFDVILVYDLSRFARNQAVLHSALRDLRAAKCELRVVVGDYDATNDRLRAGMEGIIAEDHSVGHGKKVALAYARRFNLGLHTGDTPFGYARVTTDVPLVLVPVEADAIRWAFEAYANGLGYHAIAAEFNARGLKPHSKVGYEAFVPSSVQRVLTNRFYAGYIQHKGEERRGAHQPCISDELFQKAQIGIRHFRRTRNVERLLTGCARCLSCNGPLWASGSYYREPSHLQLRQCENQRTLWASAEVDAHVAKVMQSMNLGEDWMDFVRKESRIARSMANDSEREELLQERKRLGLLFRRGVLTETEWTAEDEAIAVQLARTEPVLTEVLLGASELSNYAQIWETLLPEERLASVRSVFRFVSLDTKSRNPLTDIQFHPREKYLKIFDFKASFTAVCTPERGGAFLQQCFSLTTLGVAA